MYKRFHIVQCPPNLLLSLKKTSFFFENISFISDSVKLFEISKSLFGSLKSFFEL